MSPEIRIITRDALSIIDRLNGRDPSAHEVAHVSLPDESGVYETVELGTVALDVSRINPANQEQIMGLGIGSEQWNVYLSSQGRGGVRITSDLHASVALNHPIREQGHWSRSRSIEPVSRRVRTDFPRICFRGERPRDPVYREVVVPTKVIYWRRRG